MDKRYRIGAATCIGLLAVLSNFLFVGSSAFCLEKPTRQQILQYQADGTWKQRLEDARAFGNHLVNPALLERMHYNTRRLILASEGASEQTIDQTLAPPPAWVGLPTMGNVKILILLIAFADTPPIASDTLSVMQSKIFGSGSGGFPYESLTNYYQRSSYNQLTFQGDVLGWYTTAYNRSAVVQTSTGRENLIKEALNYYDSQGTDFSQYDNDGDGKIDYFAVIWTGAHGEWASFWWGYQTSFVDQTYMLDGKKLSKYSWQWESSTYPSGSYSPLVLIHETGHALGLPDLYDYDGSVGPDGGVGGLDMMDATRGDHNCFSKYLLEWITPTVTSSGTGPHTLNSSGSTGDALLIMPGATGSTLFDEFFMVQSRFREANDTPFPNDGLLIWHIDSRLNVSGTNYIYDNSYASHKLVRLMEADGLEEIEQNLSADAGDYYVAGNSFGFTTIPNSSRYDGTATGVLIDSIAVGSLQASFNAALYDVPTANITQPSQYQIIKGTVMIQASVTDAAAITQVQFFVDGASIGTDFADPYEASWNASAAGNGRHTLLVEATNEYGVANTSVAVDVFVAASRTQALVIDLGSDNDSRLAIASALAANRIQPVIASSITAIDPAVYPAAFVFLGYYPGNKILTSGESSYLTAYLDAGGALYLEGGDTWAYDTHRAIHSYMGIEGVADSGGTLGTMSGQTGTITQGISFGVVGIQRYVDSIKVATGVTDAAVIWKNNSPLFSTGVARDTGTYRSIGCSFEFGNIPGANRDAVIKAYLEFMGIHAQTTPVPDFDGDWKTDGAVYRPADGLWYALSSLTPGSYTVTQWGAPGDVPTPGDYDGDGKTDIAVWRPNTGVWYALSSSVPGKYTATAWGLDTDVPVPGDYDGDGTVDVAVWRPSAGVWYMLPSGSPGTYAATTWGLDTDVPVPGDYDGDGTDDIAVYRPSTGVWYVLPSHAPGTYTATQWGIPGDVPTPGSYDADAKTDIAVYRPTTGIWYVLPSGSPGNYTTTLWGSTGDIPVSGDYDGDGRSDIAVWRPGDGIWYILPSGAPGTYRSTQWGLPSDVPISAITAILQQAP